MEQVHAVAHGAERTKRRADEKSEQRVARGDDHESDGEQHRRSQCPGSGKGRGKQRSHRENGGGRMAADHARTSFTTRSAASPPPRNATALDQPPREVIQAQAMAVATALATTSQAGCRCRPSRKPSAAVRGRTTTRTEGPCCAADDLRRELIDGGHVAEGECEPVGDCESEPGQRLVKRQPGRDDRRRPPGPRQMKSTAA